LIEDRIESPVYKEREKERERGTGKWEWECKKEKEKGERQIVGPGETQCN